jgi:hypothetical protein
LAVSDVVKSARFGNFLILIDFGSAEAALAAFHDSTWVVERWGCDLQWKRAKK